MARKPQEAKMVRRNPAPRPDDPAQSKDFIKKAREIGADEERSVSDELIGQLAKKPPEPHKKKEH
jgi:hypothetical protein